MKVSNELPEVPYHPHKPLDRGIGIWLWEVNDGLDMLLTRLYSILCDVMHEVCDFIVEQVTTSRV